jgi:hypothetical protein
MPSREQIRGFTAQLCIGVHEPPTGAAENGSAGQVPCGWPRAQERAPTVRSFPGRSLRAYGQTKISFGGPLSPFRHADAPGDFPAADFPQRMRR